MRSEISRADDAALQLLRRARRSQLSAVATALACFALVGLLVAVHPLAAVVPLVATGAVYLALRPDIAVTAFLAILFILLAGYAFMGRGFAYLGVQPIYVGELVLAMGMLVLLLAERRSLRPIHLLIGAFIVWGAVRTIPYVGEYSLDALRDAVAWGYASFAIAIALMIRRAHVRALVVCYSRIVPLLVIWIPLFALIWFTSREVLPTAPGTGVPIPYFKAGDFAVHLGGAGAFVLASVAPATRLRGMAEPVWWAVWILGFTAVAALNRGGMLAASVATSFVLLFVRSFARWLVPILVGLTLISVVAVSRLEADVGNGRSVSVTQLMENFISVVGRSEDPGLTGTTAWRAEWWGSIVDYTFGGPYFWDGKGYGINLAEDDGFVGLDFPDLRAPHNAHIQFLARSGVPGFALWVAIQAGFAMIMVRSAWRCGRARRSGWLALHAWILAYWLAALINMTFDVYLEGPQGGIVFWSILGAGLGVASISQETADDLWADARDGISRPSSI